MRKSSIRFQITALATVVVAAVLLVASVTLIGVQRSQLTGTIDAALRQRADDLAALVAQRGMLPESFAGGGEEGFAQLVSTDGRVLVASANLAGKPALPIDAPAGSDSLRTLPVPDIDDEAFRVLTRMVTVAGDPALLHVGASDEFVAESTGVLGGTLTIAIPIVVFLLAALIWWLVGRTLRPVEAIRSQVAEIGVTDLHRRVPRPESDDEVARLAVTMNGMLARLETSLDRQRRFVADASHELRSPLTRMRAELEVRLAELSPGLEREQLESLLDEVVGVQQLVEDLLQLARVDAGETTLRLEAVDLDDLVLREGSRLQVEGHVTVEMSAVSAAQVTGDAHQLSRAVKNLVDNAGRHAATLVKLSLEESDGEAVLVVADDGPGIPASGAQRIFERFARLDDSRSQETGGTGLGLAIVKEIITRHGGTVALDDGVETGARFIVKLPLTAGS